MWREQNRPYYCLRVIMSRHRDGKTEISTRKINYRWNLWKKSAFILKLKPAQFSFDFCCGIRMQRDYFSCVLYNCKRSALRFIANQHTNINNKRLFNSQKTNSSNEWRKKIESIQLSDEWNRPREIDSVRKYICNGIVFEFNKSKSGNNANLKWNHFSYSAPIHTRALCWCTYSWPSCEALKTHQNEGWQEPLVLKTLSFAYDSVTLDSIHFLQ